MKWPKWVKNLRRGTKEHAPGILMVGGTLCFAGAIVSAVVGTCKCSDTLDEYKKTMSDANECEAILLRGEEMHDSNGEPYELADVKNDRKIAVAHLGVGLLKCYWLTIIFSTASITMFLAAYGIMKKRYAGATLALATVTESFNKYRERVRNVVGEEDEQRLYRGEDIVKVTRDTGLTNKNGDSIAEEVEEIHVNDIIPPYAKFFDESNPNWDKNPEYNLRYLLRKQNQMNDLLHRKMSGVLTLNEVYRALDIPETQLGNEVGWVWETGDEVVDFGLFDQNKKWEGGNERVRRFVNGEENVVLLVFNCVPIKHLLPKA